MLHRTDELDGLLARARAIRFPTGTFLGTATAAYQIEGGVSEDGRGESIWDRFSHKPGVISDGTTGDLACDHYHRWREDLALMRRLNANAYRFSIAWSRILPQGRGVPNEKGLVFYEHLVDALLECGIEPFVTLYHWDLPQALQDDGGGWMRRGIADDFVAYAEIVTRRLGDRVKRWTTFNELWTFGWWGYAFGEDAPGLKLGVTGALTSAHHALLAHGRALPVIRANVANAQVGIVLDVNHVSPASDTPEDVAAAQRFDGCQNRWYLDAVFRGTYPEDMLRLYGDLAPDVRPGDLTVQSLDYLGINVYRRSIIAAGDNWPPLDFKRIEPPGDYTGTGWEVYPEGLHAIASYVWANYGPSALYITENGAAYPDYVGADGSVLDIERCRYLVSHLEQMALAVRDGIPLRGYFAWTLMDNFEWAYGLSQRFGLIHVDFATQERRIKASGEIFAAIGASLTRRDVGIQASTA